MADFVKYQALGNDYLVFDAQQSRWQPSPAAARQLCDRHFGIGADGVLYGPTSPVRAGQPVELTTFNSDGSTCHLSANGVRMFALYLAEHYLDATSFTIRTPAGDSQVEISDYAAGLVQVNLGRPSFEAGEIPVLELAGPAVGWPLDLGSEQLTVTCVNNGNPHTVVFLDTLTADRARELGPRISRHPRFPDRTNVEFAHVHSRSLIEIEIWERGAGYTLASGGSACAVASAAHLAGLVEDRLTVRMPGGQLQISIGADLSVTMAGVVEKVALGDFSASFGSRLGMPTDRNPVLA